MTGRDKIAMFAGAETMIDNDFVYAMIGHRPSVRLLEACGLI